MEILVGDMFIQTFMMCMILRVSRYNMKAQELFTFSEKPNPLTRWAEAQTWTIIFPHEMGRFKTAVRHKYIKRIGRYSDRIEFVKLPSHLQTLPLANVANSRLVSGTFSSQKNDLMCGSPYEVEMSQNTGTNTCLGATTVR